MSACEVGTLFGISKITEEMRAADVVHCSSSVAFDPV